MTWLTVHVREHAPQNAEICYWNSRACPGLEVNQAFAPASILPPSIRPADHLNTNLEELSLDQKLESRKS